MFFDFAWDELTTILTDGQQSDQSEQHHTPTSPAEKFSAFFFLMMSNVCLIAIFTFHFLRFERHPNSNNIRINLLKILALIFYACEQPQRLIE